MTSIPHSRPTLDAADAAAVAGVLQSGQVAQGPQVAAFEGAMARYLGLAGGVAVSSGTAALELALRVLRVGPGDEVLVPTYACLAPWLAVTRVGAVPRLVDCDPDTFAMSAASVSVSARTKAAIVVHPFGLPADMDAWTRLGVPIIEDCAQTLGAVAGDHAVGSRGAVTVCSFYATKLLCTGEGGMLLSNDQSLTETARSIRGYDENPKASDQSFNYKLTDMQAALGLSQLSRLPTFLARRTAIASTYTKALAATGAALPSVPGGYTHAFFRYVIRPAAGNLARQGGLDRLLERLQTMGVHCRRPVFEPIHRRLQLGGFPAADEAHERAVSIPIYPSLTDAEVTRVVEAVQRALTA
jgi:perosamine synthetase